MHPCWQDQIHFCSFSCGVVSVRTRWKLLGEPALHFELQKRRCVVTRSTLGIVIYDFQKKIFTRFRTPQRLKSSYEPTFVLLSDKYVLVYCWEKSTQVNIGFIEPLSSSAQYWIYDLEQCSLGFEVKEIRYEKNVTASDFFPINSKLFLIRSQERTSGLKYLQVNYGICEITSNKQVVSYQTKSVLDATYCLCPKYFVVRYTVGVLSWEDGCEYLAVIDIGSFKTREIKMTISGKDVTNGNVQYLSENKLLYTCEQGFVVVDLLRCVTLKEFRAEKGLRLDLSYVNASNNTFAYVLGPEGGGGNAKIFWTDSKMDSTLAVQNKESLRTFSRIIRGFCGGMIIWVQAVNFSELLFSEKNPSEAEKNIVLHYGSEEGNRIEKEDSFLHDLRELRKLTAEKTNFITIQLYDCSKKQYLNHHAFAQIPRIVVFSPFKLLLLFRDLDWIYMLNIRNNVVKLIYNSRFDDVKKYDEDQIIITAGKKILLWKISCLKELKSYLVCCWSTLGLPMEILRYEIMRYLRGDSADDFDVWSERIVSSILGD